jgi:hypothetical protein
VRALKSALKKCHLRKKSVFFLKKSFFKSKVFHRNRLKMDGGYQGTYQNGSVREADFQRLAQNIGTNIQKILQNGEKHTENSLNKNQGGLGHLGTRQFNNFPLLLPPGFMSIVTCLQGTFIFQKRFIQNNLSCRPQVESSRFLNF